MENNNQSDEFNTMNIESINIDEMLKDESLEKNEKHTHSDEDSFEEEAFYNKGFDEKDFAEEAETIIDDSDLKEIEDWFESETRNVESLKRECYEFHKTCQQKKQEIKTIKDMVFSTDCKNDMEIIYSSIETETCKNIKDHANEIGKNIRTNKSMAEMYMRNLKRDTELLTLQFDYTNLIEKFSTVCSEWNKRQKKIDDLRPEILSFAAEREDRRQQARREQEKRIKITKIKDIISR